MNTYQSNRTLLQQSKRLRRQNTSYKLSAGTISTELRESSKTQSELNISSFNHHHQIHYETKVELQKFKKQNQALRIDNQNLKNQLKWYKLFVKRHQSQLSPDIDAVPILAQMQNQRCKLKKIIQKSYISLKQMEKECVNQSNQISSLTAENNQILRNLQMLELENQSLRNKLSYSNTYAHEKQIRDLNNRIRKMQQILDHLLYQFEQTKQIEAQQRKQLLQLKRYYSRNQHEY